jgi:hypothetical protein
MGKKEHTLLYSYKRLHRQRRHYDGGACLTHCKSAYMAGNSCSYRWQAVHRAQHEDLEIYKGEFRLHRPVARSKSYVRSLVKNGSARVASAAAQGERLEVVGIPFKTSFSPWPNNAHHLLPVGTLHKAIDSISSNNRNITIRIIQDLLINKYNINYFVNMMILPQRASDSYRLGLPTHPGFAKGRRARIATHSDYSKKVRTKVMAIMRPYSNWTKNACTNPPEGKDIVDKLNQFSKKLHDAIVSDSARSYFRSMHEHRMNKLDKGKPGSVDAMCINTKFFRDIVAHVCI